MQNRSRTGNKHLPTTPSGNRQQSAINKDIEDSKETSTFPISDNFKKQLELKKMIVIANILKQQNEEPIYSDEYQWIN